MYCIYIEPHTLVLCAVSVYCIYTRLLHLSLVLSSADTLSCAFHVHSHELHVKLALCLTLGVRFIAIFFFHPAQ